MAKSPRKRFNAFDDFPAEAQEEAAAPAAATPAARGIAESVTTVTNPAAAQVERIERLAPSQMLPDRFQPRRLLPVSLREAFFSGKINCYQAAAQWLTMAQHDPGYRAEVERLLSMGLSFEEHGQIKPITGSWVQATDGSFLFQIETGERRFWAACLQATQQHLQEEPLLRVEVVSQPTRQRQVLENRHAEVPSAVGQACEVAALILAEMNIPPQGEFRDEYDYFRQARAQRMPAGLWDKLMPVMQLTRPRMVQLLNILQLPTQLLDLADRYRLPERVLREVLALPREQWDSILRASIQNNLTSEEIAEAAERETKGEPARPKEPSSYDPARVAANALRKFAVTLGELDDFSQAQALDQIADTFIASGQAEGIINMLSELSILVTARLRRK
jgi:hypothetical protein